MRLMTGIILLLLCVGTALADASYDSERNVVMLKTPMLSPSIGAITIYSEDHVEIMASGFDTNKGGVVGMCGIAPSLGILMLNGKLGVGTGVPRVSAVRAFGNAGEPTREPLDAGWVHMFVLKGDDALDLLDLLHSYDSVGFVFQNDTGCKEDGIFVHGVVAVNFSTRGFERAMRRLR